MRVLKVRLDKFLWAVRLRKTRALATEACRAGHVCMDGNPLKPSWNVAEGAIFTLRNPGITRTFRILQLADKRMGAGLVENFLEDLTPPEAWETLRLTEAQRILFRASGTGRPTKKERRDLVKAHILSPWDE